ncbi:site-specific integrase [Cupriavidus sp. AcVe19-6a]|uniref:tyrosine-type recombinase/integrase n=1 Tax=Cupriavidus sp. AcVe19-6a TaxID=2821358 RepID=UPI001AE5DF06|nr:site-specific integrase [Cupriavidus sp. AcVe19-6a]MBP0634240.1 site-specific integrase [Cupriavidus sp. AcVe19-6a]
MATQALRSNSQASRLAFEAVPVRALSSANRRPLTVAELCDAYMAAYAGADRSRGPVLQRWCAYLDGLLAADIDPDHIADALDHWASVPVRRYMGRDEAGHNLYRDMGLPAPASINRNKAVLSAVFTWAQQKRLMPKGWSNPCRAVPARAADNARTRYLTPSERKRLLATAKVSTWNRLYLLVLMGLTTGARRGELLGLCYRDLDLDAATAHLHRTKNGDERVLPLPPAVVAEIRRLGKAPHPDALLFHRVGHWDRPFHIDKAWNAALTAARIADFRFHDLRHSCASYLAQNGGSLLEIADVLGHRTLDVTKRYAHLCTDSKTRLINRVMGDLQ